MHPNHPPTPLAKLSRRILLICPNSASVERLWSVFGTILTRLRTRLGNKALVTLAELKLYLREEHLRTQAVRARLKRSFGAAFESPSDPSEVSVTSVVSGTVPTYVTEPHMQPATTIAADEDTDYHNSELGPQIDELVEELVQAVGIDDEIPLAPSPNALSICIENLFDSKQSYWIEAYEKLAMRGLQDELELYELLDLDAEGDTVEYEADDTLNE